MNRFWLEQFLQDTRYAGRILRREPGFTAVVILTLALGVGMNTAMFSVVSAVLFHPLAYPDAERLIWLTDYDYLYDHRDNYVSRPAFTEWRAQARSFEGMAAYGNQDLALIADAQSSQERIATITGDFWRIVGTRAVLGRLFRAEDTHAMVLSHALFQRRFGGDPRAIGKTVTVNGFPMTITGVLPATFRCILPQQFANGDEVRDIDAYIPVPEVVLHLPELSVTKWEEATRGLGPVPYNVRVVAKLRPEISAEQARVEMETVYARAFQNYPDFRRKHVRLNFVPLQEKLVGGARRALLVLQAAAGFVLLLAVANIANLLLARAATRQREIAIRSALGAGRSRVLRQFLAESLLLALLGGAAGLVVAYWSLKIMIRLGPHAVSRLGEAFIDGWVLVFTLAISLSAGVLCGLGPALFLSKGHPQRALQQEVRTARVGALRFNIHGLIVAAELALAVALLCGAGLMLRSFWRMNAYPSGFDPARILVMRVPLSGPEYEAWPRKGAYIKEMTRRVEAVPGVRAAGITGVTFHLAVRVAGVPRAASGGEPSAAVRMVSPGYLRAMGVALVAGRWPDERDWLDSVVVNERFARATAGVQASIGRQISGSFLSGSIVGVVEDFKYWQLDAEPMAELYYPYERSPVTRSVRIAVQTEGDAMTLAPTLRKLVSEIDLSQPVYELQSLEQALSESIAPRRFNLFVLGAFASVALLMGLVGIYGVMAHLVARRRHEIGIRMALGAQRREIVRMVVRYGMSMALAGVVVGVAAAVALTRLMASLLYDVQVGDPLTFGVVAATMVATALLACWAPAVRASRVDPIQALHHETGQP